MEIKCIIVDDEQLARNLLESYVKKVPQLTLVRSCKNSMEAIECLQNEDIDLMFLDIQMPDLTGVELLQTLAEKPVVIFTTAYKEYALEGYQLDVIDYMLKPISFERFVQGVNKATEQIKLKTFTHKKEEKEPATKPTKDYITLKADYKVYKVKYDDILYIEGLKEYVTFYTENQKTVVLESLKHLEDILPSQKFMRVHKSYIINKDKVTSLYGNQVEIVDKYIPVGKTYIDEVKKVLF